jgi:hypothetical protein
MSQAIVKRRSRSLPRGGIARCAIPCFGIDGEAEQKMKMQEKGRCECEERERRFVE